MKRIMELAQQASEDLDPEDFMGASEEFMEKLAELIIRECLDEIEKGVPLAGIARERVLKHFGVDQ